MTKKLKTHLVPLIIASVYFLLIHISMGLRPEHMLLVGGLLTFYFLHPKSRLWVIDFFPIALFGILYDFLRIYPKSWAGPIQVVWPHRLESFLFGWMVGGNGRIPNDYFLTHHLPIVDFITGVAYSMHMIVPLGFAFLAWLKDPKFIRRFNWTFFILNLLAFATYIGLPAAPPWYVQQFGFQPGDWSVIPQAAGLVRFDQIIGHPYFEKVYAENAWVFGAIPSMHAGFPFLVVTGARRIFPRYAPIFIGFMLLVWFSAVYLCHHYIIDLMAGVLYVFVALLIAKYLWRRESKT